jgi:carbamoyl-phosphate synthase large subunit
MMSVLLTSIGTDSAVALCEALRAGFPTGLRLTGVDTRTAVACMPWLDHFARVPPRTSPDFLDHVTRLCEEHGVTHVWPLSTEDQILMALERANRLRHTVVIGSAAEVVAIANDKVRLYGACAAGGLPLPAHHIVRDAGSLHDAARALGYPDRPVVLKAALGTGAAGLKIIRAGIPRLDMFHSRLNRDVTLEVAAAQLEGVSPWPSLMLTEYLPGEEFSVDVLRFRGAWKGGVVRRRDESLFGLATDATVVDRPDVLEEARRVADHVGVEFVSNVQFRGADDGRPLLMEINPRVPGTIGLSVAAGSNLPAVALALAAGREAVLQAPRIGTRMIRYFAGTVLQT